MNKISVLVTALLLTVFFSSFQDACAELSTAQVQSDRIIELGRVPLSVPQQTSVLLPVSSDTNYEIEQITVSCECVTILSYNKTIRTGSKNNLNILYLPDTKGDFAYEIQIFPVDPEKPVHTFLMMVTVYDDGAPPAKKIIPFAPELLTRVIREPEPGYSISAYNALRMLQSGSATFVDTRQPGEYNTTHIPGSINMPLYAVKTKPFLRSKPVILVDKGTERQENELECTLLRQAGFEAYILEGGLNYWCQREYPLSGNYFAQQTLYSIDAIELYKSRHFSNWLVVDVSSSQPETVPLIPDWVKIHVNGNDAFQRMLEKHIQEFNPDTLVSVAIISDTPDDYEKVAAVSSTIKNAQFYFVDGGKGAYQQFLQNQSLIIHPPQHTKRQKTCGTCPQEEINAVIKN